MVEHTRNDDGAESFDLTVRCPGVAFDVGQKGFTRVLVVQKLADTVTEYDDRRGDGEKGQLEYFKNALVGATPDDAVYQCIYLPDNPVKRGGLNDPKTRYPVPESRLVPMRHDEADPIDDSPRWSPAEAVQHDTLESLFDVAIGLGDDTPAPDEVEAMAEYAGLDSDVVRSAREASEAYAENYPDMALDDEAQLDDSGMEAELVTEGEPEPAVQTPEDNQPEADSESETDRDDPPEPPEDGGPDSVDELDDGELGDFDPDGDL